MSVRKHNAFARRDSNHDVVRGWYEELFCHVVDTHTLGFGFPDFVVSCSGTWSLVEVKNSDGELTPAQERFIRDAKAKVDVVCTHDDVIAHVQRLRRDQEYKRKIR